MPIPCQAGLHEQGVAIGICFVEDVLDLGVSTFLQVQEHAGLLAAEEHHCYHSVKHAVNTLLQFMQFMVVYEPLQLMKKNI